MNVGNIRTLIDVVQVFIAIGLALAVIWLGRRRSDATPAEPSFDPYRHPFGDVEGFSREQLEEIARRLPNDAQNFVLPDGPLYRFPSAGALQADAGGGRSIPSGAPAVRNLRSIR